MNDVEAAIQYAKKYLEDLLSFFGLNTDVYATTEDNEVIELNIPSTHLNGFLIGQRGETMRSHAVFGERRAEEPELRRVPRERGRCRVQEAARRPAWLKHGRGVGEERCRKRANHLR
jgi:hypothetical protein